MLGRSLFQLLRPGPTVQAKLTAELVRPLVLIDVHVLGVDDIVFLLVLAIGARRTSAFAGSRARRRTGSRTCADRGHRSGLCVVQQRFLSAYRQPDRGCS